MKIRILLCSALLFLPWVAHSAGLATCGEADRTYVLTGAQTEQERIVDRLNVRASIHAHLCDTLGLSGSYLFPGARHGALSVIGWNGHDWEWRITLEVKDLDDLLR